ncbi:hypothetical protein ABZY16_37210 [Streptomyces sp. NPDC006553]|uniref:hypothetical protein n=1 Tax=unclassified Streptomyces TaxID=2593676 RepID=UPI0022579A05|nr:hypothetical protein [Streptomyces sp. NBC_00233]MCX5228803.1 hypothetical protein [Streptomyces sp. NBC_00233]
MTTETTDAECLALTRNLRRRGAIVLAVFALVWAFAGGSGIAAVPVSVAVGVVAAVVTAGAVVFAFRGTAGPATRLVRLPEKWNRGVGLVNMAELVAIFAVIAASNASGHPEFIPIGICLVVGLHFFPLARLFDQGQYKWTAIFLTAVALVGLVVLAAGTTAETIRTVVGLGAAVVLWASSFHVALRG